MRRTNVTLSALAATLLMTSCVFVQPTVDGKKVRVLTAGEVEKCRSLGTMTSTVADRVGVIRRGREAVEDDVTLNAKNSAASMGADTVVPISAMENGKQTFGVYRCLTP